jgi:hypothetical protein
MKDEDLCAYLTQKKTVHLQNKHMNRAENLHSIFYHNKKCKTVIVENFQNPQYNSKYPISKSNTYKKLSNF